MTTPTRSTKPKNPKPAKPATAPAPSPKDAAPAKPPRDLTREYVAGGRTTQPFQRLSWAFDDLTKEMGDQVYVRMMNDPIVNANISVLKTAILSDGMNLTSAITDKDADGYDQAAQLVGEAERALSDMVFPFEDALWSLLDALAYGCKVAEEVYELDKAGTKRQYVLRALKPKPRSAVAFVVDPYMNVRGLVGRDANGTMNGSVVNEAQLLPREKFTVFSFRPPDADIRGSTLLRPSYNPWDLKCNILPEYYKYLVRFGTPSLLGVAGADTEDEESGAAMTGVEALLSALLDFRNGSIVAVPHDASVKELVTTGEGKAFLEAIGLFDRQITTGILTQTRATMEAEHGSKADSETSAGWMGMMISQMRKSLARTVRADVLRDLVRYNYGDALAPLTPKASFGSSTHDALTQYMTAVAALERVDYLDVSQLAAIDERMGLPARTAEELRRRQEKADAPPPTTLLPGSTSGKQQPPADDQAKPAKPAKQ